MQNVAMTSVMELEDFQKETFPYDIVTLPLFAAHFHKIQSKRHYDS